jgi:hypothetical protein
MFATFIQGFNTVANNIYLILLPVLLDLYLWLGPHLSLQKILQPFFEQLLSQMTTLGSVDTSTMGSYKQAFDAFSEQFNLFTTLHTFPVGLPGLFTFPLQLISPIGKPMIISVLNSGLAFSLILLFTLIGILLGSLYFNLLARATSAEKPPFSLHDIFWQSLQVLWMTLLLLGLIIVLGIPVSMIIGLITLFLPGTADLVMVVAILAAIWVLMPLIFSPHGIFTSMTPTMKSIVTSVRLVRFFLPGTSFFILSAFMFDQILTLLWTTPTADSWLLVIGIAGNAFVSTALIAASFIYYRGGMAWMNENLKRLQEVNQIKV